MGKRQSKPSSIQAWISRESPEGGCVIINDTSSQTRLLEEILKQKRTVTAYEGYLVNEEDNLDPIDWDSGKCKSEDNFPIEIVELPSEPDGKHIDVHFMREGHQNGGTQTTASLKPEDIECGVSVRSMNSDRQQWSFSLYNFEDNGRISREDLTNLVQSIYDALGKSVDKSNKKSSSDQVKKVKVHISVSKQKQSKEMRGAAIVPRREVAIGAEDTTAEAERQLEHLKLEQIAQEKKIRKGKEDKYSTVQVLNNDLSRSGRCKSCWPEQHNKFDITKRCSGQAVKNNNLLADNCPSRRQTGPGECLTETKIALLNQDLAQLVDKKTKSKRRTSRRRPTHHPGHVSPGGQNSGHSSPLLQVPGRLSPGVYGSGHTSPVPNITGHISMVPGKDVPLDPSYAYHADESKYLYVHAVPRKSPFEEPKARRKRRSKTKKARDGSHENSEEVPGKVAGSAVVHKHEHVHHHYHHYGEKR